jgi:hypothetical protein
LPFAIERAIRRDQLRDAADKPTLELGDAATLLASDPTKQPTTAPVHATPGPQQPAPAPEQQFAIDNHPRIITGVRSTLLPNGGTMQIRLDPPELGDLQISINLRDGVMSASFQTSNDEATRLLSHSLGQLKGVLESQGVSVDKLHVQQAPRNEPSNHPITTSIINRAKPTIPPPAANRSAASCCDGCGEGCLRAAIHSTWSRSSFAMLLKQIWTDAADAAHGSSR